MERVHITLVPRVFAALEALANITGQSVSALVNEAATEYLRTRNLLPEITPQMIAEHMQAAHLPKTKRRTAKDLANAKAKSGKSAASAGR